LNPLSGWEQNWKWSLISKEETPPVFKRLELAEKNNDYLSDQGPGILHLNPLACLGSLPLNQKLKSTPLFFDASFFYTL
jgi:hypothetical protein